MLSGAIAQAPLWAHMPHNMPLSQEAQGQYVYEDPEKLFEDLIEIGHGSFGAVYYVSLF